jgi:hypothetical protein
LFLAGDRVDCARRRRDDVPEPAELHDPAPHNLFAAQITRPMMFTSSASRS